MSKAGLAAAALTFAFSIGSGKATPILDFSGGGYGSSGSPVTRGWSFSLTTAIQVDGIGIWDQDADGLINSHPIGLWDGTGSTLLTTAIITNLNGEPEPSSNTGRWLFVDIAPITLSPGAYVLGAGYSGGADDGVRGGFGAEAVTIPGVTFVDAREISSAFTFPSFRSPINTPPLAGAGEFGPNLRVSAVPEPASLMLSMMGIAAIWLSWVWAR